MALVIKTNSKKYLFVNGVSPAANRPRIQVDEIGFGVIPHATAFHGDTQIPQALGAIAGQPDIDGPAFGVKTGARHAFGCLAQHDVGGW